MPEGGTAVPHLRLSPRLTAVLDAVPRGRPVADIGSGHGLLAEALARRGEVVVATERTAAAMSLLDADLARLRSDVETRLGDGLAVFEPDEVAVAVVAGLGGRSIIGLLERSPWLPATLVLQPAQDADMVQEWLAAQGWTVDTTAVRERGRDYAVMRVQGR